MPVTEVAASPTAQPTATETPEPTEIPDPMLHAAETLGADWGSLEKVGDQWIYDSPEDVIVGKDVEVTLGTLKIDGVDRSAILVDGQWPIALENESGDWAETGIEYVDVTRPLVDEEGNSVSLTYEFRGDPAKMVTGFFVANGETYTENGVDFLPVAASLDGKSDGGLMLTNLTLPLEQDLPSSTFWARVRTYSNNIYIQGDTSTVPAKGNFSLSQLERGEVFLTGVWFDVNNIETEIETARQSGNAFNENRLTRMLENREKIRRLFDNIMERRFDSSMLGEIELHAPVFFGVAGR
ncbi:MAG: hypothetical protein WEA61_08575 [Anaerolineales bacterium]